MEYAGLTSKYPTNRPLTDEERNLQLKQGEKLKIPPIYQVSVIKMNSSFMEMVDKYYRYKGSLTAILLLVLAGMIIVSGLVVKICLKGIQHGIGDIAGFIFFICVAVIGIGAMVIFCLWFLRKESFRWTHYPIRLNRKNGMVYVFRLDGTVLTAPWKDLFFTLGRGGIFGGIESWDVRAHVLEADGKTVKESFAFGYYSTSKDNVRTLWEYIRRYMEEGPVEPYKLLKYCLPIDEKKEPRILGLQLMWIDLNGQLSGQLFQFPFNLFDWLGRQFALATCKIPKWPKDVEDACKIEPGDKYVKDGLYQSP